MNETTLLPERLREARRALGITKLEAARRMHLTQSGYVRYEAGERAPVYAVIQSMALVLGTSVAYLTGETADPRADAILIEEKTDPALYALAKRLAAMNEGQLNAVVHYLDSLPPDIGGAF